MEQPGNDKRPLIPELTLIFICFTVYWLPRMLTGSIFSFVPSFPGRLTTYGFVKLFITCWLIWQIRTETDRPTLEELGFTTKNWKLMILAGILIFGFAALVTGLYSRLIVNLGVPSGDYEPDYSFESNFWTIIHSPLWEEAVYRLLALTILARRYSHMQASFIVSVWFVGKHFLAWHLAGLTPQYVFFYILFRIILWTMMDYLFLRYRSILLPLTFHTAWNASSVAGGTLPEIFQAMGYFLELSLAGLFIYFAPWLFTTLDTATGLKTKPFSNHIDPFRRAWQRLLTLVPERMDFPTLKAMGLALFLCFATEPLGIVMSWDPNLGAGIFLMLLFGLPLVTYYYIFEKNRFRKRGHFQYKMRSLDPRKPDEMMKDRTPASINPPLALAVMDEEHRA